MSKKDDNMRPPARALSEEEQEDLWKVIARESHRGCVLVSHAIIDDALELVLRRSFQEACGGARHGIRAGEWLMRTKPLPPLGGYFLKVKVACAIGRLTEPMETALLAINDMRNTHAHGIEAFAFDLRCLDKMAAYFKDKRLKKFKKQAKNVDADDYTAALFAIMAVSLYFRLLWVAEGLKERV